MTSPERTFPLTPGILRGSVRSTARCLRGSVRSTARCLPGAIVTVVDQAGLQRCRTETGPEGEFRVHGAIEPGHVLIVSGTGHRPFAQTLDRSATSGHLNVVLEPATEIRGIVRDRTDGSPVAMATVTAVGPAGDVLASTASDLEGRYSVRGLGLPSVTLVAVAPGAEPSAQTVPLEPTLDCEIDLLLDLTATLEGTLSTPDGPLSGVRLALRDSTGRVSAATLTDEHGRYRFDGLTPAAYTLISVTSAPEVTVVPAGTPSADFRLPPAVDSTVDG